MRLLPFSAAVVLLLACSCAPQNPRAEKIRFDLSQLDENGLVGPPDGKRALAYEFCIPAGDTYAAQVRAIDGSVEVHRGSRGRIGCVEGQVLCVGSTYQPRFRDVLDRLAELPYVERIEETVFE